MKVSRALGALVPQTGPGVLRAALAIACAVAAGAVLRIFLSLFLPVYFPFATFFPAVLLVAIYAGFWPGLLTVLLAGPLAMMIYAGAQERSVFLGGLVLWLFNGSVLAAMGAAMRRLILEHRRQTAALLGSERRLSMLLGEFEHRFRNSFTLVRAISDQTARRSKTVNKYRDALHARLDAFAAAQSLLTSTTGEAVELESLVDAALKPFRADTSSRVRIVRGPGALLESRCATALALALHELATNAAKYGALSVASGRVDLSWRRAGDGRVDITWRESGGPAVSPPASEGFGSDLIRNAFQAADASEVFVDFKREGLVCRMLFQPAETPRDEPAEAGIDDDAGAAHAA